MSAPFSLLHYTLTVKSLCPMISRLCLLTCPLHRKGPRHPQTVSSNKSQSRSCSVSATQNEYTPSGSCKSSQVSLSWRSQNSITNMLSSGLRCPSDGENLRSGSPFLPPPQEDHISHAVVNTEEGDCHRLSGELCMLTYSVDMPRASQPGFSAQSRLIPQVTHVGGPETWAHSVRLLS